IAVVSKSHIAFSANGKSHSSFASLFGIRVGRGRRAFRNGIGGEVFPRTPCFSRQIKPKKILGICFSCITKSHIGFVVNHKTKGAAARRSGKLIGRTVYPVALVGGAFVFCRARG